MSVYSCFRGVTCDVLNAVAILAHVASEVPQHSSWAHDFFLSLIEAIASDAERSSFLLAPAVGIERCPRATLY